jgi:hypothetical protein
MSFDFAPQGAPINGVGTDGWAGREKMPFAKFFKKHKQDVFKSQAAGMPVAIAVDCIEIRQIGEKDSVIREVRPDDKSNFAAAWNAYVQGQEQVQSGTPLSALFPANPEVVTELNTRNVWTVQALANVADSVQGIPFLADYKKRAETYLKGVEKGKGFHELQAKLEESELKRIEQDDLIKSLSDRLKALEPSKPQE